MPFRKIKFLSELHAQEEIFLVTRKHWILPTIKLVFWIGLLVILGGVELVLKALFPELALPPWSNIIELVRTLLLMTALLGIFITLVLYYLNVQILTNQRIVDIYQKSLLHHQTSELNLDRLQDVTTEIQGPLANFFNFGNVVVQTAGERENFVFNDIADPHEVAKIILGLYERIRSQQIRGAGNN